MPAFPSDADNHFQGLYERVKNRNDLASVTRPLQHSVDKGIEDMTFIGPEWRSAVFRTTRASLTSYTSRKNPSHHRRDGKWDPEFHTTR